LGPFIVFGTFIFKEVLRERQKDLLDELKSEERTFVIRNQIHLLYRLVWQMNFKDFGNVDESKLQFPKDGSDPTYEVLKPFLDSFRKEGELNQEAIYSSLENAEELQSKLNPSSSVKAVPAELMKYVQETERMVQSDLDIAEKVAQEGHQENIDTAFIAKDLQSWENAQTQMGEEILKFTGNVLAKLHASLDEAEKNYRIFTNFSYGLYTLGFLVTLGGQLLGIKAPSEG
jgi:hypothetical protein